MAEKEYTFQSCIFGKLISEIGCQPYWLDSEMRSGLPRCSQDSQLKEFFDKIGEVGVWSEEKLHKEFKCFKPCNYMEYKARYRTLRYRNFNYIIILLKIVEEPVTFYEVSNETKIWLNFASPKVTIKKEVESYSVPSLVADYGGFLGLSVGFNFLMIWECLVIIFAKMKGRKLFYVV